MRNPFMWLFAALALVLGGVIAQDNVLGPDDSDLLAAASLAAPANQAWTSVYSRRVEETNYDIEVIRHGNAVVQVCRFQSKIGDDAPEAVGDCIRIVPRFMS